jgi:uncharacterized protein YxeA
MNTVLLIIIALMALVIAGLVSTRRSAVPTSGPHTTTYVYESRDTTITNLEAKVKRLNREIASYKAKEAERSEGGSRRSSTFAGFHVEGAAPSTKSLVKAASSASAEAPMSSYADSALALVALADSIAVTASTPSQVEDVSYACSNDVYVASCTSE